jgi:WD40 repeat protein
MRLATVAQDGTLCLWDTTDGRQVGEIRHADPLNGVEFSDDGRMLLTVSKKARKVVLHEAATLAPQSIIDVGRHMRFATERDILFVSHEEEILVNIWTVSLLRAFAKNPYHTFSDDDRVAVLDVATGQVMAWFPTALRGLVASPTGHHWAGFNDTHVYLLELAFA